MRPQAILCEANGFAIDGLKLDVKAHKVKD
jgi:hypothetical protein